eukprot:4867208-Amphidinium_carterae.1
MPAMIAWWKKGVELHPFVLGQDLSSAASLWLLRVSCRGDLGLNLVSNNLILTDPKKSFVETFMAPLVCGYHHVQKSSLPALIPNYNKSVFKEILDLVASET